MATAISANVSRPTLNVAPLIHASTSNRQNLQDVHELLNRLYIRNRNQHRRNHWFKSLQQFRKQLGLLLAENSASRGTVVKRDRLMKRVEARIRHWDDRWVHGWYLHFTQLVAVQSFAVLGLVLMACTARVCRIVGITALYEEIASEDMKLVLGALDDGIVVEEFGLVVGGDACDEDSDEGVVLMRET